ncbi:hypothetical protein [Bordetella genomosp. 11]|uniref:hypothetical protein n=1 Tax=Bordetella genomosp. 11 TaxID=1416808 RepID=UPI0011409075|nr:hypothetical protein [Bordetella genomosp. 11]
MSEVHRYAIVNTATNEVENVTIWDGDTTQWQPPAGMVANLLPDDSPVAPGWKWMGGDEYSPPADLSTQ